MDPKTNVGQSTLPPAEPAGQQNPDPQIDVQKKMETLEQQAAEGAKARKDLEELQNYFSQRKDLYEAALLYDKDPNFKQSLKSYLSGGGMGGNQNSTPVAAPDDLSFLDDGQRAALNSYIEKTIGARMEPVSQEISQLRGHVTTSQIKEMRSSLTKEQGFPFNFQEVESDIATMIQRGEAVGAKEAYFQLVGQRFPGIKAESDKLLKEQKRLISGSRYTAPTSYPMKSEGPKSFLDAVRQAQEQVGS